MRVQYIVPDIDDNRLSDKAIKIRRLFGVNTPFFLSDLKLVDAPGTFTPMDRYDQVEWYDANGDIVWRYIEEISVTKDELDVGFVALMDTCWKININENPSPHNNKFPTKDDIIVGIGISMNHVSLKTADMSLYVCSHEEYNQLSLVEHKTTEFFPTYVPTTVERFDCKYVVSKDAKFYNSSFTRDELIERTKSKPFNLRNFGHATTMWYTIEPGNMQIHISDVCQLERVEEIPPMEDTSLVFTQPTPPIQFQFVVPKQEIKVQRGYTSVEQINTDIQCCEDFINKLKALRAGINSIPTESMSEFQFVITTDLKLPTL